MANVDVRRVVFIDEMGSNTNLTRLFARALRGLLAICRVPRNYRENISVIGALGFDNMRAAMSVEGPVDAVVFETFIEQILLPKLKGGDIVLMDNLNVHKTERVRKLIESAGGRLVLLPSYSPDFSPIENCWSKIKESLRAAGARTK
jgi:transposase